MQQSKKSGVSAIGTKKDKNPYLQDPDETIGDYIREFLTTKTWTVLIMTATLLTSGPIFMAFAPHWLSNPMWSKFNLVKELISFVIIVSVLLYLLI